MIDRRMLLCLALLGAMALPGCGGGNLTLRSVESDATQSVLRGQFDQAFYSFDNHNDLHVLLLRGSAENPAEALHIRMNWLPVAGRTPIDRNATNAVVHYIVFQGDQTAVYSGGGYLFPNVKPGGNSFSGQLRNATLRLEDASKGFVDELGLTLGEGSFSARRNDLQTQRRLAQIEGLLRDRLGYPRLVVR